MIKSRKAAVLIVLFVCAVAGKNVSEDRQIRKVFENQSDKLSSGKPMHDESTNRDMVEEYKEAARQQQWVTQLFDEAERKFDLHPDVNPLCRRDYELYKMHLTNQSVWAVRMMESTEWPSVGIFTGRVAHFGNFDECLHVSSHGVKGQYCLASATYSNVHAPIINHDDIQLESVHEESSVWNAIESFRENPVRIDRHKLSWAICLPSTCSNNELSMSLKRTVQPIFKGHGLNISIDVEPTFCHVKTEPNYPLAYYYTSGLIGLLFSLIVIATTYEATTKKKLKEGKRDSLGIRVLKSFSMIGNFKKLNHYSPESDYILMNFVKIANILIVIYGHRFIYYIGYPKFNAEVVEKRYRGSSIELIHTNVVDVFFAVSGFLTYYFGYLPMLKGGGIFLVLSIVFRWIRMVPVFMLLVLFIVNVLPYTGDGPLWNYRVYGEAAQCENSWLSTLLAVNNIVNPEKQCLVISWYIATDIQLTILGSILLFAITRHKIFGTTLSVLAFIGAISTTFVVAYINNFHGLLLLYMGLLEEPRRSDEFKYFYIAPYARAGPYLMGFFGAYIVKTLQDRNYSFSDKQKLIIFIGSILLGEGSQYYGTNFYISGRKYDRVEHAIYAALNRSLFVLPYTAASVLYFVSGLGWFQKLLERRIFMPLGRLTYSVFLVNTVIQLFQASSQRTIMGSSEGRLNLFYLAVSDILLSYIFGLILHLFAEAPITNLSKILQSQTVKLFLKKHRREEKEGTVKSDSLSGDDKSTQYSSKNSSPELNGGKTYQSGYQNHSYVNNELVPNISEDSRI